MNVLMIVAAQNFRDEELLEPRRALQQAGYSVTIASNHLGTCVGVHGAKVEATRTLDAVNTVGFDGVVFVGGPGAREFFADPQAHRIAVEMDRQHKVIGAICVAPVILARAGLLAGRRATVFETEVRELVQARALVRSLGVVADGSLITASGPTHAREFGERLVKALAEHSAPRSTQPPSQPRVGV